MAVPECTCSSHVYLSDVKGAGLRVTRGGRGIPGGSEGNDGS